MKIPPLKSTILAIILMTSPALAAERFPELSLDQMTPEQRKAAEGILAGPRGAIRGPFNTLLRSPDLADRVQRVGEYLRFSATMPARLKEFAILITARHWDAQFEWFAHYPLAMKGGLDPQIAEDLRQGRRPTGMKEDEAAVYDFATELRTTRRVSDATYARAKAALGEQGVVDLIGISGYYDLVSMVLNVADVPLPPGEELPLKPIAR